MINIVEAINNEYDPQIRELFWEYLQWANSRVNAEFGVTFDIAVMIEDDMQHLDKFMPPSGRLWLCYSGDHLAGIVCLKELTTDIGEIKRMYVRPEYRRKGIGRALLERLIREAQQIGYDIIKLDSARFMKEAHLMYQAEGFREIESYEGSEIPKEFQEHWIFMEMELFERRGKG